MNVITLDTETTGLECKFDEILQLSIIDDNYNTLFDEYFKPVIKTSWDGAERVNGISPFFVQNKPSFKSRLNRINEITLNADVIIGYNTWFDIRFMNEWGVKFKDNVQIVDVMQMFADLHGTYSEKYGRNKWMPLTYAASFYGYSFKAHNSLEDSKGTLYVYNKVLEELKPQG